MYNVIIVDDEPIIRNFYSDVIEWNSIGFSVKGLFKNGAEALEFIKDNNVDCLITDIKMSPINGIELLKLAKKKNPNTKVILISAYSNFEFAKNAVKYGASDYLLKPFDPEELKQRMIKVKDELDMKNQHSAVFYQYQRNFLNSVILEGKYTDEENFDEIMHEHNIGIKENSKLALVYAKAKENSLSDAISSHEKDAFCVSLQNMINEMLEDINGYFLSYDNNTLNYLIYSTNEKSNFNIAVQAHIDGLKKALEKHMNILFENVSTDFLNNIEAFKKYHLESRELPYQKDNIEYDNYAVTSIKAAKKYIEENPGEDMSLEKISSKYFLSTSYFSRVFKNIFGFTYVEFLIKCRMQKAKELIISTDYKIYHIGKLVGYEDTRFFAKTFKSFYGISPKEYREKYSRID